MPVMTTDLKQAAPSHGYYRRAATFHTPSITPGTVLPPRDLFAGRDELLAAYDEFAALSAAMRHHNLEQGRHLREAKDAEQAYHRAKRDAMAKGEDPAKVKNAAAEHAAQAAEHEGYAATAKRGAAEVGHRLGQMIHEAAPDLFAPAEADLEKAAEKMRDALAIVEQAWATYAQAWQTRTLVSASHFLGGSLPGWKDAPRLPEPVATALATLTDQAGNLDKLKSDEANLTAWREQQARAAAASIGLD